MRVWVLAAVAGLVAGLVPAQAAEIRAGSRVQSVIVFPVGAEVARIAKVKLEAGDHSILFNDLPAAAIASSIRVEGKATGKLQIGSVDSRRVMVPRNDAASAASDRRRIELEIERLKDERAVQDAAIQAAEAQQTLLKNLAELPGRPVPAGTNPQPVDWTQILSLLGQRVGDVQKTILDIRIKQRDIDRRVADLEKELAKLAPGQDQRTEVKVFVHAGAPLESDLVVRYQVASASWLPLYDARLMTGTKAVAPKLQLVRRASIQQRSGESWDDVALTLSTARPNAGTAAPELTPVTVDFERERPPPPPVAMAPAPARGMVRDEARARVGAVAEKAREMQADQAVQAQDVRASIELQAFQALYAIPGRVTVPATGEAKRLQIDEVQLDPVLSVRTVPKRDQKAFLYAKLVLARDTPILPGQVSLFRDGTFVGNGRLPLLAPGEEHELGFGVDDAVRVRYAVVEEKRGETGLISSSKTEARNYRITIKNLHERPIVVTTLDQMPVSQNQDIKVELLGKVAPTKKDVDDKRGVLAWEAKIEPDEERTVEFGYRISWPAAKKIEFGQ
ncbi:MAG: mucoidy inhibitor MuiA family protein [Hyphomicrobiaceae bacterium]